MAAHRYWRVTGLQSYGGGALELSEMHLYGGVSRLDAAATLNGNITPATGAVANLSDNNTATGAAWNAKDIPSLVLTWDFGGATADVSHVLVGDAGGIARFPLVFVLQWSDDGVTWTTQEIFSGMAWPGTRAIQVTYSLAGRWSRTDRGSPSYVSSDQTEAGSTAAVAARSMLGASSGIRQFELERTDSTQETLYYGLGRTAAPVAATVGSTADSWRVSSGTGNKGTNNVEAAYTSTTGLSATGSVVGVVVNFATGTITFYKNGVSLGVAYTDASIVGSILYPMIGRGGSGQLASTKLRMSGFTYPVAGASDWATGYTAPRNIVTASAAGGVVSVVSAASGRITMGLTRLCAVGQGRKDYLTGVSGQGIGRVRGFTLDYVNPLNRPYPCRVRLLREADGLVVHEQWSKADGSYDFLYVDELQSYTVLAYYLAHAKRAVVTDGLTLANGKVELMS